MKGYIVNDRPGVLLGYGLCLTLYYNVQSSRDGPMRFYPEQRGAELLDLPNMVIPTGAENQLRSLHFQSSSC